MDWPAWTAAQKAHDAALAAEGHLPRGSEINVSEEDAMKMTGQQLDEYMDYYERTFVDPERVEQKSRGLPKQLLDMFPISRLDGSEPIPYSYQEQAEKEQVAAEQTLKHVVGSLRLRPVTSGAGDGGDGEEGVHRVGSFYKRYRRVEDLDGVASVFYERVAEKVGVSIETLVLAVSQVERLLIRWREKKRKQKADENDEEDREDMDIEMEDARKDSDEESFSN